MNKQFMSNEKVLLAAGVTQEEINAIKTADATTAVNTLDQIHEKLMSFVSTQRIEKANLDNPLKDLEKGYASLNGGKLNGFFQEILVPARDKGNNNLYGGRNYQPKTIKNPYVELDYGKEPLSYVFGVNAKIERSLHYDRNDFLMALKEGSLSDYISSKLATLEEENKGSRYIIENNVLNCERFQYKPYAEVEAFDNAYDLDAFIQKVFFSQKFPETNMEYKKTKFNTTRGTGEFVLILDGTFYYDFARKFQIGSFLKPFIFKSEDSESYGAQREISRIILVDKLNATSLADNAILDPTNMNPYQFQDGKRLIGRIVDFNAVKFGIGMKNTVAYPLNARTSYYNEISDYVFNMSDAYVNVPLVVTADFDANRKFNIVNNA